MELNWPEKKYKDGDIDVDKSISSLDINNIKSVNQN